jgi:CRP/FNR family cyclic AMP-dependent transcriptional regulator
MIQETPQADLFKQQMRESLRLETLNSRAVTIAKNDNVYTCGDNDEMVYFIESGQVKLLMLSPEGRECLLAIHTTGDIFGELCLSGLGARLETATAMEETKLKQIPCSKFFARLGSDSLFAGFVQCLAVRIAGQLKVTHEELSEMVGATRPRISMFMQRFTNLGLIETNEDRFLVIKEKKLTDYLAHIA